LFRTLDVACLFVDAGPLRDLARDLALALNGIPAQISGTDTLDLNARMVCGAVSWEGVRKCWSGLRCAAVEFTGKTGTGIAQAVRRTPSNDTVYPVISCNRDEAIEMTIADLLTADDGLQQVDATGKLRTDPLWLLPQDVPGALPAVATLHQHILNGSRLETDANGKDRHYIDQVENHLLLASTYSRLAEAVAAGEAGRKPASGAGRVIAADLDGDGLADIHDSSGGPLL